MIDVEPLIVSELDRILPLPDGGRADWQNVIHRAGLDRRRLLPRRQFVAVAVAAAVVAALVATTTPVGAAIAHTLDGFSAWISGEPGTPASPAEQQAFQQANARSWSGFPPGTELRRLIETNVSGTNYTLFGFRSGDELCLRLIVSGAVSATSTHCAPLQALQTTEEPALVVAADEPFGTANTPPNNQGYVPPAGAASFGIVSDGVTQVLLHADGGTHDALVASNAFLYVADDPDVGVRVRSVDAVAGDGSKVALPFQSSPYGTVDLPQPPKGTPQGPSHLDRQIRGGTIGWLGRHELRGEPLPPELRQYPTLRDSYVFGRLIQPDPQSPDRIALVLVSSLLAPPNAPADAHGPGICRNLILAGSLATTGCSPIDRVFELGPLNVSLGGSGSDQFSLLSGIASDDVTKIKVFLASGQAIDVPLKDNTLLTRISRAAFPIRVVAYDSQQSVIDIETFQSDGMTNPAPPQARTSIRERFRVSAADGTTAVVTAGDPAGGYRCWSISYGNGGAQGGGCTPWPLTDTITKGNPLLLIGVTATGSDVFLGGQVPDKVASVTVTFPDGTIEQTKTEDGFVAYPIPAAELDNGSTTMALRAYDQSGALIAQRGLRVGGKG
jgi:hypothetical protein